MNNITDSSLARMDSMFIALNPRRQDEQILGDLNANLELLYIKAKNFHWNVSGVGFQGVHETFDKIQEYAVDQADRIAERMRYYSFPVCACASVFLQKAWFPEGDLSLDQEGMLTDMMNTLQCIHDHILRDLPVVSCPVSQNMMQDICEGIDRFNYFIKGNMAITPPPPPVM